jgi:hypothetical protein
VSFAGLARAAVAPKKEVAMHEQWEYKLLIGHGFAQKLKDADGVDYGRLSQEVLNRLGKEGWEVCGYSFSFVSPRILILKRKVASG